MVLTVSNAQPAPKKRTALQCHPDQLCWGLLSRTIRSRRNQHARQPRSTPAHRHRRHYAWRCRFVGIAMVFRLRSRAHPYSFSAINSSRSPSNVTPQVLCTTPASRHAVLTRCSVMPNQGAHRQSASQPFRLKQQQRRTVLHTAVTPSHQQHPLSQIRSSVGPTMVYRPWPISARFMSQPRQRRGSPLKDTELPYNYFSLPFPSHSGSLRPAPRALACNNAVS